MNKKTKKRLKFHKVMIRFFGSFYDDLPEHRENLIRMYASYEGRRRKSAYKTFKMFLKFIDAHQQARNDLRKGIVY